MEAIQDEAASSAKPRLRGIRISEELRKGDRSQKKQEL